MVVEANETRYSDEVPAAMRVLDAGIADVWSWCEATGRLVVLASMGQSAAPALDTSATGTAVVRDPTRFAEALGVSSPFVVGSAMVPQIHYSFDTEEAPGGLMLVDDDSMSQQLPVVVDALDVAPMLLSALGLAPVGAMRAPEARL